MTAALPPPLRVGIIGAGNIAENHFKGYRAAGAEVIALADVNPLALATRSREWNVTKTFGDYADLLSLADLDAVSVCTPNAFHAPATIAAAQAGKHVLCEKPISLSLAEAETMIAAAREAGVVLQVNHHLRSNRAVTRARRMIDAGELGHITFVRLRQAHDWGGAATVPASFRTRGVAGGGTLLDNGCHLFDLARFLAGPVSEVFARIATLKFDTDVEDTAIASLRFESGALGEIETAWTATGWDEGFWVYGTLGALEYSVRSGRAILRHVFRGSPDGGWADPDVETWEPTGGSSHSSHLAAFVAAIRGEREVICSGEDGREAVRLVLASYESAASGRPVSLQGAPS